MKKRLQRIYFVLTLLLAQAAFAQTGTITGTVVDDQGSPLPGVNVVINGTNTGTQTDFDGNYSISAQTGDVLVFSFVGLKTSRFTVGDIDIIDVVLTTDSAELEAVIVTAINIERKPKELGYSVAQVDAEKLNQAKAFNVGSGLSGKVSGLQINTISNGVNPSTRVVLRGNRSLRGNNQALIVIDGFPASRSALDQLNPNDISNVNVLKGANAAALYGSQATNGALIITTKSGGDTGGKLVIGVSSSVSVEKVQYMPERQERFGPGYDLDTYVPIENTSWGPAYDGTIRQVGPTLEDGSFLELPYSPIHNNLLDFWNTGYTYQNNISVGGGDDVSSFYVSAYDQKSEGIIPNDEFHKNNFRLKGYRKYGNLEISGNLSYTVTGTNTTTDNVYNNLLNVPANIPLTSLSDWRNNKFAAPNGYFSGYYENPYYTIDNRRAKNNIENMLGLITASYDINDWINITYRAGIETFTSYGKTFANSVDYTDAYDRPGDLAASVSDFSNFQRKINTDLLLTLNKDLTDDLSLRVILGNNIKDNYSKNIDVSANPLVIDGLYNVSNRQGELGGGESNYRDRLTGLYGDITLGYKDYLFLNATGRNDWSSALSKENRSFFYPSLGLSFVPTDAISGLKGDFLNYFKIAGSFTRVGSSTSPYQLQDVFNVGGGFPYGSQAGFTDGNRTNDPQLTPEFTTAYEGSINLGFFGNRILLDATYYTSTSKDQIVPIAVSTTTGKNEALINAGEIFNQGVELDLNTVPISNNNMRWNIGFNFTWQDSEVKDLYSGLTQIELGGYANSAYIYAEKGERYPTIKTTSYERDPQGRIVVDADTGYPIQASGLQTQGSTVPEFVVGLNTDFSYKNWRIAATFDYRTNYVFYNRVANTMTFTGGNVVTAEHDRLPFVVPNSVIETSPGVYQPNTDIQTADGGFAYFYNQYNSVQENYVTDATFFKLREVSLGYSVPKTILERTPFTYVELSLIGRNIFTILPKENVWTDPEFNFDAGNAIGISSYQSPPTRFYGLNVNVKL